jgi:hypothetical protein
MTSQGILGYISSGRNLKSLIGGKESVQEESDNWQEAQHARMQEGGDSWKEATNTCREGRPNDSRVRVFVRFLCKWMKSPIDINIDTKVS